MGGKVLGTWANTQENVGGRKNLYAGPRRLHLADAQRQATRIGRCLDKKRSIHQVVRELQDIKPADARDPRARATHQTDVPVALL